MTRALKSGNLSHFVIRLLCLLCCLGNAFGFPQNFTPNSIGSHLITSCVLDTSSDNTFQFLTTGPLGPQVPKCTDPVCDGCVPWTAIHPLDDLAEHWPHCFYSDLSASFCELMPRAFENPKTNSAGFRADLSACEVTESSFEVLTDARPIGSTLAIYEVQQTQAKTGFALLSGLATRWIRYLLSALHTTYVIILCFGILSWASSVTSWMPMFRIVLSLSERVSATVFCFVCLLKLFRCCFVLDILLPQTSPKSFVVVLREFRLGALRVLMEHVGSNFYHADGFQNMDGCVKPD